jgi:phosphoribosyl 1,2-cyclic phosphodiesterase
MFKVIRTGSKGNCYVLGNKDLLILECGISFKIFLKSIDFNLNNISGCLVTHEHGDHFKYIKQFADNCINIYSAKETFKEDTHRNYNHVLYENCYSIGSFKVIPFRTIHDALNSYGYYINNPDIGTVVFATDCKKILTRFTNVTCFIVEANYSDDLLDENVKSGKYHPSLAKRIRNNHMSIDDCIEFLKRNDLSKCRKIILTHLSESNSNRNIFVDKVSKATGIETEIAINETEYNI